MNPDFPDFLTFLANAGFTSTVLPATSPYPQWAYNVAIETVNMVLQQVAPDTYTLAVYNLATSYLVNFAQDQSGQNFFANLRSKLNIDGPVLGPVTSTSDEGTSVSVQVPDFVKQLSIEELQQLKDPWGRRYLMLAQKAGSVWGLN